MSALLSNEQTAAVLNALGEDLLTEIPAQHDGKGGYKLDYWVLVDWFVNTPPAFLEKVTGYANAKALMVD